MPVDDRDERPSRSSPETSETAPDAPASDAGGGPAPGRPTRRGLRRYATRRNAGWAALAVAAVAVVAVLLVLLLYRTGRVDNLIAGQIVRTLATYGIRAELKEFHTKFGPRTVEVVGLDAYDAQTGEKLGRIGRLLATIRVEDLYALSLRRNVNLEALEIDGLEVWVQFDEQGRSNFRNIRLPPPEPNRRILFSYSTARISLRNGLIHYGDAEHRLAGEAKNVRATIQPDDPNAPAESWMNRVEVALSDSTFAWDGRPVRPIDIEARGRVNQTRAEVQELILRSPVAEARLTGTMDDWRNLRYQMRVTSTVDLTQLSDALRTEATLRGAGRFEGTVAGEGTRYTVEGQAASDALAADNIRLQALNVTAKAEGDGAAYQAQGRAVAELLTVGDFRLNLLQLAGGVMGTGTDFRFLGDLRAAAARSGDVSIAGLFLSDAEVEYREGNIVGSVARANVSQVSASGTRVGGVTASGVKFSAKDAQNFSGSVASVNAGTITADGTRLDGVTASGITAAGEGGVTNVVTDVVRLSGGTVAGARLGSINVAGVRLAIHEGGRVEGSSGDINAGTVAFTLGNAKSGVQQGRVENVRLARPTFVLEPAGRYRASADLSLGGGLLGEFRLGAARSRIVASNNEIQLNDFTAEALNGRARGQAVINTARGSSRVRADFEGLDVGGLLALATGRAVPVAGATTGDVNLTFPGTNVQLASGTLNARLSGEAGGEEAGRTPVTGELALRADRGLFNIERANLRAGASELTAAGRFSFEDDSDLRLNLNSADAGELQRIVLATNLIPSLEENLSALGVELGGQLTFDGTVRGQLDAPQVNGRASLASLRMGGRDLGALTASLESTADVLRVPDGRLTQAGGGSAQFALTVPFNQPNGTTVDATLDRLDLGPLLAAFTSPGGAQGDELRAQLATVGPASGRINVTGIPDAMSGRADVTIGPGLIRGEAFEQIAARATFEGGQISLDTLDARFTRGGRVTGSGTVGMGVLARGRGGNTRFDLSLRGEGLNLALLGGLAGGAALQQVSGTADFAARATGDFLDTRSYRIDIDGAGRDVVVNGQPAGTLAIVGRTENNVFNLRLTTGILGQPQVVTASVNLADENLPTTLETTLNNVDLTQLFAALMGGRTDVRVTGRATGTIRAGGNLFGENEEGERAFSFASLSGTANFSQLVVQFADVQLAATDPLIVRFSPREITFDKTQFTGTGTNITLGGTAALGPGGTQNFTVDGDLNLRVLNGLNPNIFLAGAARVGVRIGGSFEDPRINGTASLAGATFSTLMTEQRLTVDNINGAVRFTADRAQIDSLTGRMGGGQIAVAGGASLAGFGVSQFRLTVRGDNITVPLPEDIRATADADLVAQGTMQAQFLTGTVYLRRAEYTEDIDLADFINRRREATLTEGGGGGDGALGANVRLDLRVEGRDALVVRNNLADMVGSVALQIRGSAEDPLVSGRITATRGTLAFRNDRYELTRAIVDLPPRLDADPVLNVQAESEIKGYRVIVALTGPLSQPTAVVRSEPGLPQADVVSLITRGELATGNEATSTLAQTGLGTATSLLTDTLINAPVQRATDRLFGLNRFEIDPLVAGRGGASPTARLTVGRQINRNLSLTYSTNVTADQNQVLALEYRVSDRLSFVAQYEQGSIGTLRSQRDNFSFEIRFRKRF